MKVFYRIARRDSWSQRNCASLSDVKQPCLEKLPSFLPFAPATCNRGEQTTYVSSVRNKSAAGICKKHAKTVGIVEKSMDVYMKMIGCLPLFMDKRFTNLFTEDSTMAFKKEESTTKPIIVPQKTAATPSQPVAAMAVAPVGVQVAVAAVVERKEPVTRDRSAVVALMNRLRDPDAELARDAAQTLGSLPVDAAAVDALCAVVVNADGYCHPVVRAAAAAALGQLGDRRAIESLIRGTRDSMAEASEEAIKALGLLGDARASDALRAVVRNENGFFLEHVRKTAEKALERIRSRA
jgi:hypothetical protein